MLLLHRRKGCGVLLCIAILQDIFRFSVSFWRSDSANVYPSELYTAVQALLQPLLQQQPLQPVLCTGANASTSTKRIHPGASLSNPLWRPQVQVCRSSSLMQQLLQHGMTWLNGVKQH